MANTTPNPAAAYSLVANMENEVVTMIDLARLLTMSVENNESIEQEMRSALQRLGWVMNDHCQAIEKMRGEVIGLLHGTAFPSGKAVQS